MIRRLILSLFMIAATTLALAQMAPPDPQAPGAPPDPQAQGPGPRGPMMQPGWGDMQGPMMRRGMRGHMGHGHLGKWWKNPQLVEQLGLSEQQTQQIDKIFTDHRMALVDLHAALQKAELALEPLITVDQPNEAQVIAQIDRIAAARTNLEKSNAQMLLAVRRVLTVEQWKKLQSLRMGGFGPRPGMEMPMHRPGPGGPPPGLDEDEL